MRLAVFNNKEPAQALEAHLQKQGFEVRINYEQNLQRFWFTAKPATIPGGPSERIRRVQDQLRTHKTAASQKP